MSTQQAFIAGAGMIRFGKYHERGLKSLAAEAINIALADAGLSAGDLQAAYMGNAAAAVITGQVLIPGQVVLRAMGIGTIPVVNVENACATSATAFQQAATMVAHGVYDVVLVVGYEKLHHADKQRTFAVYKGGVDVEALDAVLGGLASGDPRNDKTGGTDRSLFMDVYASAARRHMQRYGSTARHFAMIAAKNSFHGSLNPHAQYREVLSVEDVLAARTIVDPLTLPMCAPIGDGAAALVLVSQRKAAQIGLTRCVRVRASVLASGWDYPVDSDDSVPAYAADLAYDAASVGPEDLDVIELHDATAPAELTYYEFLRLAPMGEGIRLIEDGVTRLGGRVPVNTSGGLTRKGHPIGATGAGQLVELVQQLRGRAGERQVDGARIALAENGGGAIGRDVAAIVVSILEAP